MRQRMDVKEVWKAEGADNENTGGGDVHGWTTTPPKCWQWSSSTGPCSP
jgi:hypothetical protein